MTAAAVNSSVLRSHVADLNDKAFINRLLVCGMTDESGRTETSSTPASHQKFP
jgi:hypothetical protein